MKGRKKFANYTSDIELMFRITKKWKKKQLSYKEASHLLLKWEPMDKIVGEKWSIFYLAG